MNFIYESFFFTLSYSNPTLIISYCIRNYLPAAHILEQEVVSYSRYRDDDDCSRNLRPYVAESYYRMHYHTHYHICYSCICNLYFHIRSYFCQNNYRNILKVKESK